MAYPPGPGRPKGSKNRKRKDLSGEVFGRLSVVERVDDHITPSGKSHPRYRCRCECGSETLVLGHNLTNWRTTSCGQHPKHAPGPQSERKPRSYYVAMREAVENRDPAPLVKWSAAWEAYQRGRGPKP